MMLATTNHITVLELLKFHVDLTHHNISWAAICRLTVCRLVLSAYSMTVMGFDIGAFPSVANIEHVL